MLFYFQSVCFADDAVAANAVIPTLADLACGCHNGCLGFAACECAIIPGVEVTPNVIARPTSCTGGCLTCFALPVCGDAGQRQCNADRLLLF